MSGLLSFEYFVTQEPKNPTVFWKCFKTLELFLHFAILEQHFGFKMLHNCHFYKPAIADRKNPG